MTFPSFAPWDITPATFAQLLDCYPATLKAGYRNKLIDASIRKYRKHPERLNREDPIYDSQTKEYMQLDDWRYETLPKVLKERAAGEDDDTEKKNKGERQKENKLRKVHGTQSKQNENYGSVFMHKEELVKLMEWKLKHGQFRPALAGMIKTNQPEVVRKATADAYKALGDIIDKEPTRETLNETFPKKSQDILIKALRAVGTATASLILAVETEGKPNEIPFYSDDIYNWLCLDLFPGSEKNRWNYKKATSRTREDGRLDIKYNMEEYRELYEEVFKLRHHLNNSGASKNDGGNDDHNVNYARRKFSCADVERVAYVLQHLDVSGFPQAAEILERHSVAVEEAKHNFEKNQSSKDKNSKKKRKGDDDSEEEPILDVAPSKKRKAVLAQDGRGKKV